MIGILLAAGFSQRFGLEDKLLQRLPDGRMIAEAAGQHLIEAIPISVAVVRPGNTILAEALQLLGFRIVFCRKESIQMADSLKTALRHIAQWPEADGFVIALADMPYIKPATIHAVSTTLQTEESIAIPMYQGKRGHPVGFSASYLEELLAIEGDEGARAVIRLHEDEVSFLNTDDEGILLDIDTPLDLNRAG
jgi:molybdenum cofactor cytidylyltransferase